jgi:hypothetical protein
VVYNSKELRHRVNVTARSTEALHSQTSAVKADWPWFLVLSCPQVAAKAGALPATLKIAATLTGSGTNSKAAGPKRLPREKRKELREEVSE